MAELRTIAGPLIGADEVTERVESLEEDYELEDAQWWALRELTGVWTIDHILNLFSAIDLIASLHAQTDAFQKLLAMCNRNERVAWMLMGASLSFSFNTVGRRRIRSIVKPEDWGSLSADDQLMIDALNGISDLPSYLRNKGDALVLQFRNDPQLNTIAEAARERRETEELDEWLADKEEKQRVAISEGD